MLVKNNIIIKINGKIADYDDETAVGITLQSFSPSKIDSILLSTTNEFSLPRTPNNDKIFEYASRTNSVFGTDNPGIVYTNVDAYIYISGLKVFNGELHINDITSNRYNLQIVTRSVFDELNALPFSKYQTGNQEAYEYPGPSEISLMSLFAKWWHTNIQPNVVGATSSDTFANMVDYLTQITPGTDRVYYPTNDVTMLVCNNAFGEHCIRYINDSSDDPIEMYNYDNNIFENNDIANIPSAFIAGARFPYGDLTYGSSGYAYAYCGDNYRIPGYRQGYANVSPIWARLTLLIDLLEDYTGYTFNGLDAILTEYGWDKVFARCNAIELESLYSAKYEKNTVSGTYMWTMSENYPSHIVTGNVIVQKASNYGQRYGYEYDGEAINDIPDDSLTNASCLDFLKMIMKELNLSCYADSAAKVIYFQKFSDLKTANAYALTLQDEYSKKFSIDGIKQNQKISYSDVADEAEFKSLLLTCNNKTIEEGGTDDKLMEIKERHIFASTKYPMNTRYWSYQNKIGNEALKGICIGIPRNSGQRSNISYVKMFASQWVYSTPSTEPLAIRSGHTEVVSYNVSSKRMINDVLQPTVGEPMQNSDVTGYDYFQQMILYPVVQEVDVKLDYRFLHNWSNLVKVRIDGLAGEWYVQEVSEFNPRTDSTLKLKIIRLSETQNE